MKKALLIGIAMLFVASAVNAIGPAEGYIGIFADNMHSVCSYRGGGMFTMWIWALPSTHGMKAIEFAVSYPSTVFPGTVTNNPLVSVANGTLPLGISFAFTDCQFDWTWVCNQVCIVMDAVTPGIIDIIPDPTSVPPAYQISNCEPSGPLEPIIKLTPLYLQQDCRYATRDASWGAIKSLF